MVGNKKCGLGPCSLVLVCGEEKAWRSSCKTPMGVFFHAKIYQKEEEW